MSQDIFRELTVFFQSFLAGVTVILVYDVLRVTRRIIRHNTFAVAAEDLLYWIACALFLFRVLFQINDGEIRWYSIAGITIGMMLYNFTLSTMLVTAVSGVIHKFLKLFYNFFMLITRPFRWILKKILRFSKFLYKKMKIFAKFMKKQLKKIYKEVRILLCKH